MITHGGDMPQPGLDRPPGTRNASSENASSVNAGSSAAEDAEDFTNTLENEHEIPEVLRGLLPPANRRGLAWSMPPMHRLEDIYQHMATKAMELGFGKVLRHLRGRPLRVATVCSGTESPLLGLEMIQRALTSIPGASPRLRISHIFSCEIVALKQAYIERNFHPPLLFRDVTELGGSEAQTAYGSLESIPSDPDILVAGTACVDFSLLNNKKKTLEEGGESCETFKGMLEYATRYRPALVIQENVRGAPWDKLARYWEEIGYMARHVPIDTKWYYVPQTRERGYMVCIDKERLQKAGLLSDPGDEVVLQRLRNQWQDLLGKFRRDASSPAGMFLLSDDDRRLETIENGIANRIRSAASLAWDRYQVRHREYRDEFKLGNQRPISRSRPGGFVIHPPDFYWHGYFDSQPERVWETIDLKFLEKLQKGFDMHFKERWVDLSQGVDRGAEPKSAGIVGCLTPCGMPFLTTRGGPLSGLEALSLQGLPLDRMILTKESLRDLQDLAGNAMTSTCVSVAMLSALIVGHEILEKGDESTEAQAQGEQAASIEPQDEYDLMRTDLEVSEVQPVEHSDFKAKAASGAMCCTCEKQSKVKGNIVKCVLCGHTACRTCSGNPSHSYEPFSISRSQTWEFISYLKDLLPMRLMLCGLSDTDFEPFKEYLPLTVKRECDWTQLMEIVNSALHDEILFFDIKRGEDWTVVYEGKHSSLRLIISATNLQWFLYAKPPRDTPQKTFVREALAKPIARMTPVPRSLIDGEWEVSSLFSTKFVLHFSGTGAQVKSFQAECGLQDDKSLNSKVWSRLIVGGAEEDAGKLDVEIRGEYEFLPDCGTALGALYRKLPTKDWPAVYLFLDPTKLGEPVDDSCVFALEHRRMPGYGSRLTIAELSHTWRSLDVKETLIAVNAFYRPWTKATGGKLRPGATEQIVIRSLSPEVCISIGSQDCHTSCTTLISISAPAPTLNLEATPAPWKILDPGNSGESLKHLAWLVSKVGGWPEFQSWNKLVGWQDLPRHEDSVCHSCYPPSPTILWGRDGKDNIVPYEDPKSAGKYERAVKAKPSPFLVFKRVEENGQAELRFTLNVQTLAHQAYGKLIGSRGNDGVTLHWRLIPNAYEIGRETTSSFILQNNRGESPYPQPPHFQQHLRVEQLRSLAWMISQEADDIEPVTEEETEEALLSLMPWRAEVKVRIPKVIRGGILADEVGYGKTAIVLGLIDAQFEKDKRIVREETGLIPSNATVIVVPSTVFKQWLAEIEKFLGTRYKVLGIANVLNLSKKQFREVQEADIIVVSWTLINSPSYYEKMQQFTGTPRVPAKGVRHFDDWFQNALRCMKEVIRTLTTDGPEAFLREVEARRRQVEQNETTYTYVPSQRLRGQALALAKEVAAEEESDQGDIKADMEIDLGELATLKRKRGQSKIQAPIRPAGDDRKTFNILPGPQDWRSLKYPFLHAFSFNRIVIDEFTYCGEEKLTPLLSLHARSKWLLSGTPALDDFADIKSIARFFGMHLGVDDDGDVPSQSNRLKSIRKDHTSAETFQAYQPPHTEAWYGHRREVAQAFLNRFARQNTAEIDDIPLMTHVVLIEQSLVEQKVYQALYETLIEQNGWMLKTRNPNDNPQVSLVNEIMSSSEEPEEALLKCCASLEPPISLWNVETCESQIAIQREKRDALWDKFVSHIRQAATVWYRCETDCPAWQNFVDNTVTQLGDSTTAQKAIDIVKERFKTLGDWSQREHQQITAKSGNNDPDAQSKEMEGMKEMKALSPDTTSVLKEIISEERDIRFYKAILDTQTNAIPTCCNCQIEPDTKKDIAILRSCGHTLCEKCIKSISKDEQCVVSGCDGLAKASKIIRGHNLEDNMYKAGTESCKVSRLVKIIQQVPEDERVLVFAQFMDSIDHVSRSLKSANIEHRVARSHPSAITDFTDPPRSKKIRPKVLILNLGTSTAAGLNLQCANHVIFLSPLQVLTQSEWDAGMTQAIGRALRFGQMRTVHVYHLLMKKTIDVNILQERHGKLLLERRGEPVWHDLGEAWVEDSVLCEGLPCDFAK